MSGFDRLAVVLLAAGLSRRFGAADKLEQPLGGKPLAFHIAEKLARLPFAKKFAICVSDRGMVPDRLQSLGFEIAVNPDPSRGQGSSLALGAGAADRAGAEGMLICLGDMPEVSNELLAKIVGQWNTDRLRTVAASALNYRGPPALFPRAAFPALRQLEGDRGARHLLDGAIAVSASLEELRDFDRPEDFR